MIIRAVSSQFICFVSFDIYHETRFLCRSNFGLSLTINYNWLALFDKNIFIVFPYVEKSGVRVCVRILFHNL